MKSLIDMAAERGAFIDQSQSLNLFLENPTIGKLSSMYMYAWKKGVKTTYYMRSRPATRISKTTVKDSKPNTAATAAGPVMNAAPVAAAPVVKKSTQTKKLSRALLIIQKLAKRANNNNERGKQL